MIDHRRPKAAMKNMLTKILSQLKQHSAEPKREPPASVPRVPIWRPHASVPVADFPCPWCGYQHRVNLVALGELPGRGRVPMQPPAPAGGARRGLVVSPCRYFLVICFPTPKGTATLAD